MTYCAGYEAARTLVRTKLIILCPEKSVSKKYCTTLQYKINVEFQTQQYRDCLKIANLIPINKKRNKNLKMVENLSFDIISYSYETTKLWQRWKRTVLEVVTVMLHMSLLWYTTPKRYLTVRIKQYLDTRVNITMPKVCDAINLWL